MSDRPKEDPHGSGKSTIIPHIPNKPNKILKFKCTFSGTVCDAMRRRGWVECKEGEDDWDIYWCDLNQLKEVFSPKMVVEDWQRVGHFRNCYEISRKNLLVKNLKRLKHRVERAFGKAEGDKLAFFPTTFVLPMEHKVFMEEFRRTSGPDCLWIIKPAAGAQGRGIFIFNDLKDYTTWRKKYENIFALQAQQQQLQQLQSQYGTSQSPFIPHSGRNPSSEKTSSTNLSARDQYASMPDDPMRPKTGIEIKEINKNDIFVIQRYISNPYLIGGRKFDIRFYVLVTSFVPLKAWVYRDGFARFSAGQYSLEALQDVYIHLTNVAIQRTSEDYDPEKGSKWSIRNLREHLTARHGREKVDKMMNIIDNIVVRTLQSVYQIIPQDKRCFELYGFDVLIDSDLQPWLLEVNASPAFTPSNEEDYFLKCALLDDTVSVLDLEGRLTGYEKRVGGYDMIWNDGPVYANPNDCGYTKGSEDAPKLNSFLGCVNDRTRQLRDIYRNAHFIKLAQAMMQSNKTNTNTTEAHDNGGFRPPTFRQMKIAPKATDTRFPLPECCIPPKHHSNF